MLDKSNSPIPSTEIERLEQLQNLKATGNQQYTAKQYEKAVETYSNILGYEQQAPMDLLRAVRANRAASYLELGQYQRAVDDCLQFLETHRHDAKITPESARLMQKVHYRLARSYYHLGRYEDALAQLDKYLVLAGSPQEHEVNLRKLILQAQVARDHASRARGRRPFRYEVKVIGSDQPIVYAEEVSPELCIPRPPEIQTKLFLGAVVKKHHDEIMSLRQWTCWNCPLPAISMLHTPACYLHLPEPMIVDFAQPICENRGECDKLGRRVIEEEMRLMQSMGGKH